MSLKQATRQVLCPFLYPARIATLTSVRHLHVSHTRQAPPPPPSTSSSSSSTHASRAQDAPPVGWQQPQQQRTGSPFINNAGAGAGEASSSKPPPLPPTTVVTEEEIQPSPAVAAAQMAPTEAACSTLSPQSPSAPRSQKPAASSSATAAAGAQGATAVSDAKDAAAKAKATVAETAVGGAKEEKLPEVETGSTKPKSRKGMAFKAQRAAITLVVCFVALEAGGHEAACMRFIKTPTAIVRLKSLLDSPSGPRLIRIGVKNKGCAGMSYHLEYVKPEEAGRFDERVKQDGVEVLVDSKALFSIIGSEMDWQEDRLSAKFVFNNPNVTEACGCGESWTTI